MSDEERKIIQEFDERLKRLEERVKRLEKKQAANSWRLDPFKQAALERADLANRTRDDGVVIPIVIPKE